MNHLNEEQAMQSDAPLAFANSAWITWEIQVRNRSMANTLGVPLFELTSGKSRLQKYPALIIRTVKLIIKNKTKILFVQNPSIVLSFLAICLKPFLKLKVIVDAHNSGIYPLEGKSKALNFFARLICRKADYVIVTNSYIAKTVQDWGGRPFVMPDPIPDFSSHQERKNGTTKPYLLFICTWASDEPYTEVIKAGAMLGDHVDIYITGHFSKHLSTEQISAIPSNVKLLGFVSEEDYIDYFRYAAGAIDLTTRDNCLVCGGYEAVSLGIPVILSKSKVNEEVFFEGCILTMNDAASIKQSISLLLDQRDLLAAKMTTLRHHHLAVNSRAKTELLALVTAEN